MTRAARAPGPRQRPAMRVLRWAEGAYALTALTLAMALPAPSTGTMVALAHWFGTAALAGTLAWRLGRPNRASWFVAALLCAYVLATALGSAARFGAMLRVARGQPATTGLMIGVVALVWATQLVAAVCLYYVRPDMMALPTTAQRFGGGGGRGGRGT